MPGWAVCVLNELNRPDRDLPPRDTVEPGVSVPASRSIVASLAVFLVVASMLPASALGPPHPAILDPVARELGAPPVDAVAVDVVGDAQQDLVVTVTGSDTPGAGGSLLVFQRLAGGGLAQVPTEHGVPDESPGLELAVGDLDDDGDEDLVVSGESSLKVFLQAGAGLPGPRRSRPRSPWAGGRCRR